MYVVSPAKIKSFTLCPRKTWLEWNWPLPKVEGLDLLLENIVKSAYLYHSQKGDIPPFRKISSWTMKGLQNLGPENYDTEHILAVMGLWYSKYLRLCDQGIINVPMKLSIDYSTYYNDTIPIVSVGKQARLHDFVHLTKTPGSYSMKNLSNDIEVQARIWGFWKATDILPVEYVRWIHSPNTIKVVQMPVHEYNMPRYSKYMKQIIRGLKDSSFYCAFNEQCYNCVHKTTCML